MKRLGAGTWRGVGMADMRGDLDFRTGTSIMAGFKPRLVVAGLAVLCAFGLLFARFAFLQWSQHEHYVTLAESNRISILPAVPNRGLIIDQSGVILAHNYSAHTLEITPSKEANLEATIKELGKLVDIQPKDYKRFVKLKTESRSFASIPIRTRLNDEEIARFAAQQYRFPGVEIRARLFREYPQKESASHVVGYIGRISKADEQRLKDSNRFENYRGTDHMGKVGIEESYEEALHGQTGAEKVETDANGRAVRLLSRTPSAPGKTLRLAMDYRLQQFVEQQFGTRRGALVAIEPSTGGVLAFVSWPGFDPNLFVDGIDHANWNAYNQDKNKPLLNRALRGTYPPGSTYKPFMALAALHSKKRTPETSISDPGYFSLPGGGYRWRDDKAGGHGIVDMHKSIVHSCDTYYYKLAVDMGIGLINQELSKFFLGRKTGIDLKGEAEGILPSEEWKRRRFAGPRYREEQRKWFPGDTVSIGIGQGYNAMTVLQMAQATSILANRGVVFRPHLVKEIVDVTSGQRSLVEPKPLVIYDYQPEHIDVVQKAMVDTVISGTAASIGRNAPYAFGGKTGTAQVYSLKGATYVASAIQEHLRDHSWFIAYAPADKPRIALAVIVENGGFGSVAAAPLARQTMDFYLLGKRPGEVLPAKPAAKPSPKPAAAPKPAATAAASTPPATASTPAGSHTHD